MRWLLKRWWFCAGTGFMLVAVCAGYLLIPMESTRISQANCSKIQSGWAYEKVVGLLGNPTTHYGYTEYWDDEVGNRIEVSFRSREYPVELLQADGTWFTVHMTIRYVDSTSFTPTSLPLYERVALRIERRIKALWP
jgi:hypothetical protein